ncbi:FliH/SctL family protein [Thioalkalivibrio sp. AKL19]|uniref:FliH/SctL family protein n=1 Tax=Thioalkalivibrio sp. AKL19 TaxID=1266914 RepID=UPI000414094A|nr:FliH/SctL family protein [Thioalkalivibrio sp. AKL19]
MTDSPAARLYTDASASLWEPPEIGEDGVHPPRRLPTAAEIEAIEEEARKNGFEAGYAEGHELGQKEAEKAARAREDKKLRETVAALEAVAGGLADPLADATDALEPELLALVTVLARKVVQSELESRPEQIRAVLDGALAQLPGRNQEVRVHLNPDDQGLVETYGERSDTRITWVPDPTLARGGCRVEAGAASVDASLERRLQHAVEALWNGEAPMADDDAPSQGPAATRPETGPNPEDS